MENLIDLSVCYIVKNEEKYLAGSLESIKEVANEIIVVDTGSTDNTIEIAKKFNANVFTTDWENDFSKARNYSIGLALGRWILYLDADERLETPEAVLKLIQSDDNIGYVVSVISKSPLSPVPEYISTIRLFKNNPGIRFIHKAHEQIYFSLQKLGYEIRECPVAITHLGYDTDIAVLHQKAYRNLAILKTEKKPGEDYSPLKHYQLAQCYGILKDYPEAIKHLEKIKNFDGELPEYYTRETDIALQKLYKLVT